MASKEQSFNSSITRYRSRSKLATQEQLVICVGIMALCVGPVFSKRMPTFATRVTHRAGWLFKKEPIASCCPQAFRRGLPNNLLANFFVLFKNRLLFNFSGTKMPTIGSFIAEYMRVLENFFGGGKIPVKSKTRPPQPESDYSRALAVTTSSLKHHQMVPA